MIVLGIAALILAGVLIAVPALQRNQRNNNRRADISYVQAQLTAYQGSNQNALPTTAAQVANGVLNQVDESAYYAANNDWSDATDWNLEAGTAGDDGAADEYNLWVDDDTATTEHPGVGAASANGDPLPNEEHFDIFIGYRCMVETLTNPQTTAPADSDNYPNAANNTWTAAGTTVNQFVHEDGRARDFAIVYQLEGENVWRCQDNT